MTSPDDPSASVVAELDDSTEPSETEATDSAPVDDRSPLAESRRRGPLHRARHSRPRWQRALIEWGTIAVVAVLLAVGIRTFVFQAYYIPSGSMLPTLGIGDRILVNKFLFSPSSLHTGDIIVFSRPPKASCGVGEKDLVKRVIGLPGETVTSQGNTVYINGKPIAEPYLPAGTSLGPAISTQTVYGFTLPSIIPPGEFFVMGDNRADSCDSRYWGYVSADEIVGKVVLDWWHGSHPAFHIL